MLGEGAFATVYACKVNGRYDVAVKIELQVNPVIGFTGSFNMPCKFAFTNNFFETNPFWFLQKCTALSLPWECFVTLQLRDRLLHRCEAETTRVQPEIEVSVIPHEALQAPVRTCPS